MVVSNSDNKKIPELYKMEKPLLQSFFSHSDTLSIARQLLGMVLETEFEGEITSGKIVETEAYLGREDRACHAWNGRRTPRTEIMYGMGGYAYVYLCYGIHHLFNIITHSEGEPHAILIRAIEPLEGLPLMLQRRNKSNPKRNLTGGPGALSQALGIKTIHTGLEIGTSGIRIIDTGSRIPIDQVLTSPRVGVAYAKEDALLPYRFRVLNSLWTSPAK